MTASHTACTAATGTDNVVDGRPAGGTICAGGDTGLTDREGLRIEVRAAEGCVGCTRPTTRCGGIAFTSIVRPVAGADIYAANIVIGPIAGR